MELLSLLHSAPVIPVVYHADGAYVADLVRTSWKAGLRFFEYTNRGPAAKEVFHYLAQVVKDECPDLHLGVGTIYSAEDAEWFMAAGARFVVQPVMTKEVGDACHQSMVPWIPGGLTPQEIFQCHQAGAEFIKVFPGSVVGPAYIKSLLGPMPWLKLIVTGGVEPVASSVGPWLHQGAVAVGIGQQLFKAGLEPAEIEENIQELLNDIRR